VVSLALLMTAPLYGSPGRRIARWHLTTLWLWSGVHKALSLGWSTGGAAFIGSALGAPGARLAIAIGLPVVEMTIGAASISRRLWPLVRWAGLALHVGIFMTLSPLFGNVNSSVWSWNLALGVAAVLLFDPREARERASRVSRAVVAFLIAYPALFYVGIADAYLAHNLYTSNTASAQVCDVADLCSPAPFDTWDALNVPLPPEPRLYVAWFDEICAPSTTLVVTGPRTRLTDPPTIRRPACPRPGP
jgi:hypothetical protein